MGSSLKGLIDRKGLVDRDALLRNANTRGDAMRCVTAVGKDWMRQAHNA
jgi:hypothetical protein